MHKSTYSSSKMTTVTINTNNTDGWEIQLYLSTYPDTDSKISDIILTDTLHVHVFMCNLL